MLLLNVCVYLRMQIFMLLTHTVLRYNKYLMQRRITRRYSASVNLRLDTCRVYKARTNGRKLNPSQLLQNGLRVTGNATKLSPPPSVKKLKDKIHGNATRRSYVAFIVRVFFIR